MSLERRTLRVEFSTESAFRTEYLSNISNGGVFIATSERIEVRDQVVVELELDWCDERVRLEGEVVHRIGQDMAGTGAVPGVAVQFDVPAKELRDRFERVLGAVETNERVNKSGKRAAPRSPARVAVRLQLADGAEVACRSRDISTSGLLLSVDDWEPLPVGEEVGLVIAHPSNGDAMQVNGAVVRHLKTDDGDVTAIGLEFRTSAARRTEVANFVNDIRAVEHSRRLGGITGPIAELGIENLLQMFGESSPRGILTVGRGAEEGVIIFDGRELHTARLGRKTGTEALRSMLSWREGNFEFQAHLDDDTLDGPGEGISLSGAILEALCEIDENARSGAAARAPSPVSDDAVADEAGLDLDLDVDLDLDDDEMDSLVGDVTRADTAPTERRSRTSGVQQLDPSLLPPRKKKTAGETPDRARPAAKSGSRSARPKPKPKAEAGAKRAPARSRPAVAQGSRPKSRATTPAAAPARIDSSTRFEVDTAVADAMRSELGKIEEAVLDLALVGMGVARMVEVIPEPEIEVYRALDSLQERGILRPPG